MADLVPHGPPPRRRLTLREVQAEFAKLPPLDLAQWYRDRAADDLIFVSDDIDE
ncbi:MAG: hypothetical protein L0I76_03125 [Pseudonocardia sp.]|nr:hypothetical protein [Pseudonocardia sp.]